jgi:hypothetical protein
MIRSSSTSKVGGFRAVLRNTTFRNIWFAQLALSLRTVLLFSLIILAYDISGGSTRSPSRSSRTPYRPCCSRRRQVIADRVDRKLIMLWAASVARGRSADPLAALVPQLRGDFSHLLLITLIFSPWANSAPRRRR